MRYLASVLMLITVCWSSAGLAQGTIFNIQQPTPSQPVPANSTENQLPPSYIKLPQGRTSANVIAAPTPDAPANARPPNVPEPQYQQAPNESNDVYLKRLNAMTKQSTDDMERVSRDLNEKMKAMAPK